MSLRRPQPWAVRSGVLLLVVLAACGALALLLTSDLPPVQRSRASQLCLVVGGLLVGAAGVYRARRTRSRRRRRAWFLLCSAGPMAAVANSAALVGGAHASPVVDAGLLLAMVTSVAGMLTFPSAPHTRQQLLRMVLDGLIVGGAILFMVSVTLLELGQGELDVSSNLVVLVLPVLDSVVATMAVLLVVRSSARDRWRLALLTVGFLSYAVADIAFVANVNRTGEHQFGSLADLGWVAGYLFLALCAVLPERPPRPDRDTTRRGGPLLGTFLIFTFFIAAAGLAVVGGGIFALSLPSRVVWLATLITVAVRQVLLLVDNENLREQLTQRVSERTTALRQVTQQTGLMVSSVDDGIYVVDRSGFVTFANPAAERLLEHSPGGLLGQHAHSLFHAARPDGMVFPVDGCYITEAVERGLVTTAEEDVYLRRDGGRVPVEVTASPLRDEHGTHGAVVVFRDMTERQEVDRMKSEFVSVVSHELRTPLTSIRGSLGLLAGGALGPLDPRAERMVAVALASSERLTRLIDDILDVERLSSGQMPLDTAEHDAGALVTDALEQAATLALEAGVRLDAGALEGRVLGDSDRITQALLNLVGNAVKFAPRGSTVTVSATLDGGFVRFSVQDHGRGIPADMLEAVFARFQQVDSSDAREKGGTGLGLAISRSIVESMGGRIWVESEPGRRTVFSFTVPRAEQDPDGGARPVAEVSGGPAETGRDVG